MESVEHKLDLLRLIRPFTGLPVASLTSIAESAQVASFGAGTVIVRQGDPGDVVYALTEGIAEVWLEDAPQGPALLRTMRPGQLFGETAVLYQGPRSATIKARTSVTTLKIPGAVFLKLMQTSPDLALRVAVILAQRLASDRHTLVSDPTTSDAV